MPVQQIKKYVFGYGSLVSQESLRRTLKHPIDKVDLAVLNGWSRDWSILLDNSNGKGRYELEDGTVPKYVAVLNIFKPSASELPKNPNGVLFEVNEEDLMFLDGRETHYIRKDVTEDIEADVDGKVYAYVGLEEYKTLYKNSAEAILAQSYIDIVNRGFDSIGDKDAKKFSTTTIHSHLEAKPTQYVDCSIVVSKEE